MKNIKKLFSKKKNSSSQNLTKNWKDIHDDFDKHSIYQSWWENQGFNYEQAQEWINAGLEPREAHFAFYLRQKGYQANLLLNIEELKKEYRQAENCDNWGFQQNSSKWSSGNLIVDKFIKKYQLEATNANEFLEWIPYEQFSDIKYLAQGGFGKVYKSKWKNKNKNKVVALKSINNSQNIKEDFLQEIANHKLLSDKIRGGLVLSSPIWKTHKKVMSNSTIMYTTYSGNSIIDLNEARESSICEGSILECYGISQDPKTKNYLVVMHYVEGGNLRQFLQSHLNELSFKERIYQLCLIAEGLNKIHEQGLVHRDFHIGNVLCDKLPNHDHIHIHITDLGLCRPADETDQEKVYGVLPYVAPEILQEKPYTQASDIYSFGMVAYEVLTGMQPYLGLKYDIQLALAVCQGQRPKFKIKIPQLLEDLIKRCWDDDPIKRPFAKELSNFLEDWNEKSMDVESLELAIKTNRLIPTDSKKIASRLLPIKEINRQISETVEFDISELDKALEEINEEEKWKNIHPNFNRELVQQWQVLGFVAEQCRDWININSLQDQSQAIQEPKFYAWLRDEIKTTPEEILNHHSLEDLKIEFNQSQLQTQIIHNPPKNN